MADGEWSDWKKIGDDGSIADELLPATRWQYKWMIHHDFHIPHTAMDAGMGTLQMEWRTKLGSHQLYDVAKFTYYCMKDYIDPFLVAQYTYWLASGTTAVEAGDAARPSGATTGQLVFIPQGPTWASGITNGFIYGELLGDIWVGSIESGDVVEFIKWYPCSFIPSGKQLWMRSVVGEVPMQTVLDGPTHNKHEFWTRRGMLLTRRELNTDGAHDGLVSGAELTWSNEHATHLAIAPATVIIQQQLYAFDGAVIARPIDANGNPLSCLVLLYVEGSSIHVQLRTDEALHQPHTCIGRVDGNTITQEPDSMGTIISMDCDNFGAWIEDDGRLAVNANGVAERVQYQSRDRGASWYAVE